MTIAPPTMPSGGSLSVGSVILRTKAVVSGNSLHSACEDFPIGKASFRMSRRARRSGRESSEYALCSLTNGRSG